MDKLLRLAELYGTPAYIYDIECVRRSATYLRNQLPDKAQVLYSIKANPNGRIVSELRSMGCGMEASSIGEIEVAIAARVPPEEILFTGPGKTDGEVERAVHLGVRFFSVDSVSQLSSLGRIVAATSSTVSVRVLVRVNPSRLGGGFGLRMTGGSASQFGVDEETLRALVPALRGSHRCRIVGLHFYLGTNIASRDVLVSQFTQCATTAASLSRELGREWEVLNLGGGFGWPYGRRGDTMDLRGVRVEVDAAMRRVFAGSVRRPALMFESGRYLVAGSGTLITRVVDSKVSRGKRFLVLDAGIHHLGGMSGLGRVPRLNPELIDDGRADDLGPASSCDVVGPLCTPLDWLVRGCDVPHVNIGSSLAIPNVGAYGLTASLVCFLSHACPVEVVTDQGMVIDVSRLEVQRRLYSPERSTG